MIAIKKKSACHKTIRNLFASMLFGSLLTFLLVR